MPFRDVLVPEQSPAAVAAAMRFAFSGSEGRMGLHEVRQTPLDAEHKRDVPKSILTS
jgi:hypothetical protein